MKTTLWNPIRGCHKISTGCKHCYIALGDSKKGRNFDQIEVTTQYDRPVRKNKKGDYQIPSGTLVYTCFSSDFLLDDIDAYRDDFWKMMKERSDLTFLFLTKRIDRFMDVMPSDFESHYQHVHVGVSVENQEMADLRLPYLIQAPISHKSIICQPLIGPIDLSFYLKGIDLVVVGGEASKEGRIMDISWVDAIRKQCLDAHVDFSYRQAASNTMKNGILNHIPWNQLAKNARETIFESSGGK